MDQRLLALHLAFGISEDVLRSSWVGDVFSLESSAIALKTRVFPVPAPILFSLTASITKSGLLLPFAFKLLLLKRSARSIGLRTVVKL